MVAVILSSYNGEKYIRQQIDSVLSQTYSDFIFFIRDDGSIDGTVDIVESYADRRIYFERGCNLGIIGSFSILLKKALDYGCEYVFICDQDDIWYGNKLELFLNVFVNKDKPLLVFSDFASIDEKGDLIDSSYIRSSRVRIPLDGNYFPKVLAQPYIFGCACAINRQLLELIFPLPDGIEMYDSWISLSAALIGEIYFLDIISISHRFHCSNATGRLNQDSVLSRMKRLTLQFRNQCENTSLRLRQVSILKKRYCDNMKSTDYKMLDSIDKVMRKGGFALLKEVRKNNISRGGFWANIFFYLTVLFVKGDRK